ncbi:MAG: transcription termination factor Rho [Clostridia bacterium]|nr:transcription termination factor Rho [Clostridia bacterium]
MRRELSDKTLAELKETARALGIRSVTAYRKAELVEKIYELMLQNENALKAGLKLKAREGAETGEEPAKLPRIPVKTQPISDAGESGRAENYADSAADASVDAKEDNGSLSEYEGYDVAGESGESKAYGVGMLSPQQEKLQTTDSRREAGGVLDMLSEGFGFLRGQNLLPGPEDIYVSPTQIRRFRLRQGDKLWGVVRKPQEDKFESMIFVKTINGDKPDAAIRRVLFERLEAIFPDERMRLETDRTNYSMRLTDLVAPIGKGQRGMIVAPPKTGKTTLLKQIANSISRNNPECELIVLLIDERPEEVTDMRRSTNAQVLYSTFDSEPVHHIKVAEMALAYAMRQVEHKKDIVILLDSITRLARAYNLVTPPTGRTLSGGLDAGALMFPKKFFGAARNIDGGGSLTILATALVETGSRMDDIIFEEFKGTGNMELYLDRKMSERRIFPAIDINRSGTRREELLLSKRELDFLWSLRRSLGGSGTDIYEKLVSKIIATNSNAELVDVLLKSRI